MKPKEVFEDLCKELKIEHPDELQRAEILFRKGYKKGKADEWDRVCSQIEDL